MMDNPLGNRNGQTLESAMSDRVETVAQAIGGMEKSDLQKLADYLVWNHEGRAETLASYVAFAQMDKDMVARHEEFEFGRYDLEDHYIPERG